MVFDWSGFGAVFHRSQQVYALDDVLRLYDPYSPRISSKALRGQGTRSGNRWLGSEVN